MVGRFYDGGICLHVSWLNITPGTQVRPISDKSQNLWEKDLEDFEAVQKEEGHETVAPTSYQQPELRLAGYPRLGRKRVSLNQLTLFTLEDF